MITPTAASQTRHNTNHNGMALGRHAITTYKQLSHKNGDRSIKFIKTFKYLAPTSKITHQFSITNTNQSNPFSK